jgi:arylsulfatase A
MHQSIWSQRGSTLLKVMPVLLMLACAVVPTAADASPPTRPPNVVLILADDLGVEAVRSYGSEIDTPHLSALAAAGMQIENAHAMPICTPSRVRILTGRDSGRNFRDFGHLDEQETTVAKLLRSRGYRTLLAGKWQLGRGLDRRMVGASPAAAGFDEHLAWQILDEDVGSRYWGPTLWRNGVLETVEDRVFGPDLVNDAVMDFIGRHRDKPFFVFYSMLLPHDPFVLTPEMPGPADRNKRFVGMVSYLDRLVGTLVDRLEALGLKENTLIVFTADNGTHPSITTRRHGQPTRGGKGRTTDAGTLVPFIVAGPGVAKPGTRSAALVDIADILPTLADVTGSPSPSVDLDGVSLVPLMAGQRTAVRNAIYQAYRPSSFDPYTIFAFDARWKLYADGRFFDRLTDPLERTPLKLEALDDEAAQARNRFAAVIAAQPRPRETRMPPP